ncbi:hypothetical protein FNV43_RR22535 [Rhamnella rubrinervis]|uniref:Uncharacterized protein n=1 Tax=Rhamnella rubrinervis TaxID=2594499 RepID=A0A8K0GS56_9ROSA|nr:hypothetical protein FNV43_RR22535 [Rhamnella rubrinervis]
MGSFLHLTRSFTHTFFIIFFLFSLCAFKNTIISDPLGITATWVGSDICQYKGFYCDNPPDNRSATALASIDFNGFQLSAPSLDGFIDLLPDIAIFHANSNNFSGTISPKIASLPFLYELDLSNNNLFGTFPQAVLNMPGLSLLDIRFNSFTGSVPPQLFMQTLQFLFINNNDFTQKLPDNLGATPVNYLTLANNKFTGPIPMSIGNASSTLIEVLLLNNLLTGCIPYEVGFLREAVVFDAGNNRLTGPLPCSLACLGKIEQLNFTGNLLYGQIPEVVCALWNLANLSLSDNYFTRAGPICRKQIRRGVVDVRKNCIRDLPDQRSVEECAVFFSQPRSCLRPSSFSIIPCDVHPTSKLSRQPPRRLMRSRRRTNLVTTYAALSNAALPRHRL